MLFSQEMCDGRRGVCILRVVRQSTGLLIKLTERLDVENASTQTERDLLGIPETVDAVREFLVRFAAADCLGVSEDGP